VKAFKTFDLYEQFSIGDLVKRGNTFKDAVTAVFNSAEGDETQLSKGIKRYMKNMVMTLSFYILMRMPT
jgi:hypothetical protein